MKNRELHPLLEDLLSSGFAADDAGARHALHSNISGAECRFLARLIDADEGIARCLEIGCAYGVSSLAISSRLVGRPQARHIAIDPFQSSQWHGLGEFLLRRAGIDFFELIEEPSEYVLPRLCNSREGAFDLVFIDGWHTFDQIMVETFYADRLIREGGYIVFDDATMASVARAVSYLANYPGYRIAGEATLERASLLRRAAGALCKVSPRLAAMLPGNLERARFGTMVAMQKEEAVPRSWDWYRPF
jgi:predicted O-methyltransferase YrrM